MPNLVVSGAGTTAANGTYSERGTYNGFPYYNKIGEGDDPEANSIAFFSEATAITGPSGELWYYVLSEDPTDSPWDTEEGDAPAPTVTTASAGPANLKTVDGLAKASVKTINGLAIASIKTVNGLN